MTDSTVPQTNSTDNVCPACGKSWAFVGIQKFRPKYDIPDMEQVHCTNIDCDLFEQTGSPQWLRANWRNYLKADN